MNHIDAFADETELISKYSMGNAHLLWSMGLYLDFPDLEQLEKESLTDRSSDRKIDFIRLDMDLKRITLCQGYFSKTSTFKEIAPANKASDLNTAAAWLLDGDLNMVPQKLQSIIQQCRQAIKENEIDRIELLYVHNCAESDNVFCELETTRKFISERLKDVEIICKELGVQNIEKLYLAQSQSLVVVDRIECPAVVGLEEENSTWKSMVLLVPGIWLWEMFNKHGDDLFSTNYRGFLGITKKRKINSDIKRTAEQKADNFLIYNNGITILTTKIEPWTVNGLQSGIYLNGLSIINGAQTTGSLGSVSDINKLKKVKVLCKVIETSDSATIEEIVKYNNSQNVITTWDQYSNSAEQKRIKEELEGLKHKYSFKRGFSNISSKLGIEQVAQPILAFHGDFSSANRGKNYIFENRNLYNDVFNKVKGRHIIFCYTLSKAIERVFGKLKEKTNLTAFESKQLSLLRNLKSKHFLIALTGEAIETICSKKCNKTKVSFNYDASRGDVYLLDDLAEKWEPIVKTLISFVTSKVNMDFSDYIKQEEILHSLGRDLTSFIYSMKEINPNQAFDDFSNLVEEEVD